MPIDGAAGGLRAFAQMKQQYSELKIILSIGGGGAGSDLFSEVTSNPAAIENLAVTARVLVDQYGLDGIDSIASPLSCTSGSTC